MPAVAAGWRKRPSVPAGPLFNHPQALNTLTGALDGLYEAVSTEDPELPAPRQPEPQTRTTSDEPLQAHHHP